MDHDNDDVGRRMPIKQGLSPLSSLGNEEIRIHSGVTLDLDGTAGLNETGSNQRFRIEYGGTVRFGETSFMNK